MRLIPVLDLKGGAVVHARGGERAAYRPIETPLQPGDSDPAAIVAGFRALHPFAEIYIADLDGIAGRGRNHDTVCALRLEFPEVTFWVDDGSATAPAVGAMARIPNVKPVVGSETLGSVADLDAILGVAPGVALSLDFKGDVFLGPSSLLKQPETWPGTVVAMTLSAVGTAAGPDLARVATLKRLAPDRTILAAGGVRHFADVAALRAAGAAGVLLATALHAGTIKAGHLREIAGL